MNNNILFFIVIVGTVATFVECLAPPYGALKVKGKFLTDKNGKTVMLRGMSLMGSNYHPQFWNEETIRQLKCYWNINVVRAPITPKSKCCGGWFADPSQPIDNPWEWKSTRDREYGRLKEVIDASVKYGIYVIIDWHIFDFGNSTLDQGREFFANVSATWGNLPNVLFEIWNEPKSAWPVVKSYAENITDLIRTNSPNNIIIVGTPTYSQRVDTASLDPLNKTNIVYTLHYYAATHKGTQRTQTLTAINNGLPVFISEYGTVDHLGAGNVDVNSSNAWWTLADENKLSYVNWGVFPSSGTPPGSAAFLAGTTNFTIQNPDNWTPSGHLVNEKYYSTVQFTNNFGCTQ